MCLSCSCHSSHCFPTEARTQQSPLTRAEPGGGGVKVEALSLAVLGSIVLLSALSSLLSGCQWVVLVKINKHLCLWEKKLYLVITYFTL